jgi:hypothetical protein
MLKMKKILNSMGLIVLGILAAATMLRIAAIIPARATMKQLEELYHQTDCITLFRSTGDKTEVATIHDPAEIGGFFQTLDVQPTTMQLFRLTCFSSNDFGVRIFKKDGTTIEIMHLDTGGIIRSTDFPWGHDVCLKSGSSDRLVRWLCRHGEYQNNESNL